MGARFSHRAAPCLATRYWFIHRLLEEAPMTTPVYTQLLEVMRRRGGPYAGLAIPEFFALVEALFTPEEAAVNNVLERKPAPAAEIAARLGRPEAEVTALLERMADKGLCTTFAAGGGRVYQGVPFMPGIFEYQFMPGWDTPRHRELARLIQAYKAAFRAAAGTSEVRFPVTRVITVDRSIEAGNAIHTYDQVASYIDKYAIIGVGTCYCRHAARLRGEDIHGMPLEVCLWFGAAAEYAVERLGGRRLSRAEAREVLDRCEAAGLLHMSRNTAEDIDFLCNCDRWHCEVVGEMLRQPRPGRVFNSGFAPRFDPERCAACGTCVERCPPAALSLGAAGVPEADPDRCFGCAVCATGCPEGAIAMEAKPGWPGPPATTRELAAALKSGASVL
jgi:electron transport complex protein RnfB